MRADIYHDVLMFAFVLTVLSLGVCIAIAFWGGETELSRSLFHACEGAWKMGFGSILGLVAGRETALRRSQDTG